jgi:hypothetical protein
MIKQSEFDRLKELAKDKSKEAANKIHMSKCKMVLSKTLQFAESHFRWNGFLRTNLLIYQNLTIGLFLNIAKGWNQDSKAVLKISFILTIISLALLYMNGYVFHHIVQKYTKEFFKRKSLNPDKEAVAILKKEENSDPSNK